LRAGETRGARHRYGSPWYGSPRYRSPLPDFALPDRGQATDHSASAYHRRSGGGREPESGNIVISSRPSAAQFKWRDHPASRSGHSSSDLRCVTRCNSSRLGSLDLPGVAHAGPPTPGVHSSSGRSWWRSYFVGGVALFIMLSGNQGKFRDPRRYAEDLVLPLVILVLGHYFGSRSMFFLA
jgi:hypothetical protein